MIHQQLWSCFTKDMVKPEKANKDNTHLYKELRMQGHLSLEKTTKRECTSLAMSSQKRVKGHWFPWHQLFTDSPSTEM